MLTVIRTYNTKVEMTTQNEKHDAKRHLNQMNPRTVYHTV
jgi:hypothetical protein